MQFKPDLDCADKDGNTALLKAIELLSPLIPTLIQAGATVGITNNKGMNAQQLLSHLANLNGKHYTGQTWTDIGNYQNMLAQKLAQERPMQVESRQTIV